jgi:starch phosphorylase
MTVARYLVQGADVWLNTPLRPLEACGTSGMKAAANGVLNLSTLDGWWASVEAGRRNGPRAGWAIGGEQIFDNREQHDQADADALYDQIEHDLAPAFYDRRTDGLPRRWIDRMKSAISSLCHVYNSHRMVREYTESYYWASYSRQNQLVAEGTSRAKELAA